MNGAPDWQDGECCFRCRTQFTLVARKHHCRNCGNIFCAKCSSQQIPLPKLSIDKPVRVCDGCYDKLASKNEDPLALALDKTTSDNEPTKKRSSSLTGSSSSKSTTSNKPPANASAPSEQELKEEEELQLALALSLSETPAKISFPDCRQFEDPTPVVPVATTSNSSGASTSSNHYDKSATYVNNIAPSQQPSTTQPVVYNNVVTEFPQSIHQPTPVEKQQPALNSIQPQYSQDNGVPDTHQELFRFVAEVQSTSEVFTNRVNSSKLRNRPIANDSAIQGLFLKLTNMHTKLLEYIKVHEDERSGYEALQDKLSQITDARAALDALREEHQEKVRQEAAEAERQRQSQLALKLEMMRQKKSQMMQYQREVALQRIQAQEMMLRQPQTHSSSSPAANVPQQVLHQQPLPQQPLPQQPLAQQVLTQQVMPPPPPQPPQQQLQQQAHLPQLPPPPPNYPTTDINQSQHHQPSMPKQEDEALLISFDD